MVLAILRGPFLGDLFSVHKLLDFEKRSHAARRSFCFFSERSHAAWHSFCDVRKRSHAARRSPHAMQSERHAAWRSFCLSIGGLVVGYLNFQKRSHAAWRSFCFFGERSHAAWRSLYIWAIAVVQCGARSALCKVSAMQRGSRFAGRPVAAP